MISHLNKVLLFLAFLAIFFAFSITGRGQEIKYEVRGPAHCKVLKYMAYDPYCIWVPIETIPSIAFGATSLPIGIDKPKPLPTDGYGTGFILTGPIEFVSFVGGYSTFNLGKGLGLIGIDPSILQKLKELEGKKVTITIKPVQD